MSISGPPVGYVDAPVQTGRSTWIAARFVPAPWHGNSFSSVCPTKTAALQCGIPTLRRPGAVLGAVQRQARAILFTPFNDGGYVDSFHKQPDKSENMNQSRPIKTLTADSRLRRPAIASKRFRDRRHYDTWVTLVERRKGRAWMYGEIIVCVALIVLLIKLLR
jgi:hypothetical protein